MTDEERSRLRQGAAHLQRGAQAEIQRLEAMQAAASRAATARESKDEAAEKAEADRLLGAVQQAMQRRDTPGFVSAATKAREYLASSCDPRRIGPAVAQMQFMQGEAQEMLGKRGEAMKTYEITRGRIVAILRRADLPAPIRGGLSKMHRAVDAKLAH